MITCMLTAVFVVSSIHMSKTQEINKNDSRQILKLICDDKAKTLDAQLVAIERSVNLLAEHSSFLLFNDKVSFQEQISHLEEECQITAEYTPEAFSIYFHCNPDKYDSNLDFLYTLNPDTDKFYKVKPDDPYTYKEKTGMSADWYFASAETKKSCWLSPYSNTSKISGKKVILSSYTVPLFDREGDLLGVIGMDYTLEQLSEEVETISLYNTGYAFLATADGMIISHPEIPYGTDMAEVDSNLNAVKKLMANGEAPDDLFAFRFHNERKQLTFSVLRNGIYLLVSAPTREINASVKKMERESQILFIVVMVSSIMIIYCIVYKFIHPLQHLTYASQQIIKGNMQVELSYRAPDEIGELTANFRKMVLFLQEHISKINTLAYTDAMTGLKNKASYQASVNLLQERISRGYSDFAVIVFDLNNLKNTNDTLGHAAGDKLIKNAGKIICKAFAHSPVFRIGGDEFVAILENDDFHSFHDCIDEFHRINREFNEQLKDNEHVSIAYGIALFEQGQDMDYRDVFTRADKEMYRHKQSMKNENDNTPNFL